MEIGFSANISRAKRLTGLQCCREAKAPRLVKRVLGDGVPEKEDLIVQGRLAGRSIVQVEQDAWPSPVTHHVVPGGDAAVVNGVTGC